MQSLNAPSLFLILYTCNTLSISLKKSNSGFISPNRGIPTTDHRSCLQDIKEKTADCKSRNLVKVPQDLNPDIQKLFLSGNKLQVLRNTSFQEYTQLTELDLKENAIYYTERGAFYPLVNVIRLDLSSNHKIYLHDASFQRSLKLQDLYLNDCGLSTFAIPGFVNRKTQLGLKESEFSQKCTSCGQHQANDIDIRNNNFTSLTSETIAIDCHVFSRLLMDGNPLHTVNPDTIASLQVKSLFVGSLPLSLEVIKNITLGVSKSIVIERLHITFTNITIIPPDLFEHLRNKKLDLFSLRGNYNILLYPGVFKDLTHVSSLVLDLCIIKIIDPQYFEGMVELRWLQTAVTQRNSINPSNITWGVPLHGIELQYHACAEIHLYTFRGLQNLTKLSLTGDYHTCEVAPNILISQMNLHEFFLTAFLGRRPALVLDTPHLKSFHYWSINSDYWIDYNSWQLTSVRQSIERIHINARLSIYDIYELDKYYTVFCDMPRLILLDLNTNEFPYLPRATFKNLSSLESLDISRNEIRSISSDAFIGLMSLQSLYLHENEILFLPSKFLEMISTITHLSLDSNDLNYLDGDLFVSSKRLTNLTISKNRFVSFNRSTFDPLSTVVKSIDISGNNIVCNCDIKWLLEDFGGFLINEAETICAISLATLEHLRGKPITTFDVNRTCGLNIHSYLRIIGAVLGLFLISVTFIICYHYRWSLRYKRFLLKLAILGYREIQDGRNKEEFEYDINIMFLEGDEEWAINIIRPGLDRRLPNFDRIAFGDDDLTLGMRYFEAVDYNVEKSFKTILLLTRAAVQNHIFMTKFRIAMNHVTDTETENLILVFLEDIPDEELPYLVRLHLSGQGAYLSWEEDEEGQEYFWNKLTKHLNVNLRVNHLIPT